MRLMVALILLFTSSASMASNPICPTPLLVGWDPWPPYHYQGKDGHLHGFAVEVLTTVVHEMGCEVVFRERPWKRQLQEMEQGQADIAMEAYYTDDRARYAWFSDTYSPSRVYLWLASGDKTELDLSLDALIEQGFRLGLTKDFYYGPAVEKIRHHAGVDEMLSETQNYTKLQRGRIDGFLGDWLATTWNLSQQGLLARIRHTHEPVYQAPASFMLSRKHLSSAFVDQFNAAMRHIKLDGRYQRLLDNYTRIQD